MEMDELTEQTEQYRRGLLHSLAKLKMYYHRGQGFITLIKSAAAGFTTVSLMKLWPWLEPYATWEFFLLLTAGTAAASLLLGWLDFQKVKFQQREAVVGLPYSVTGYEVLYRLRDIHTRLAALEEKKQ
jgi:hypothetical protein